DGRTALSGSWDSWVKLWDVATGKELRTFRGHTRAVQSVAFSPDGRNALSGGSDGTLKLWDLAGSCGCLATRLGGPALRRPRVKRRAGASSHVRRTRLSLSQRGSRQRDSRSGQLHARLRAFSRSLLPQGYFSPRTEALLSAGGAVRRKPLLAGFFTTSARLGNEHAPVHPADLPAPGR